MSRKVKEFEKKFLISIGDKIENEVIKERLSYLFAWYSRKADRNKIFYNINRTATYVLPCLITLVGVYAIFFQSKTELSVWPSIITATISVILTFVNHRADHYRFYENWVRYRNAAEQLKRNAELYLTGCEPYDGDVDKDKLLAAAIEKIAADELSNWETLESDSYNSFMSNTSHEQNK